MFLGDRGDESHVGRNQDFPCLASLFQPPPQFAGCGPTRRRPRRVRDNPSRLFVRLVVVVVGCCGRGGGCTGFFLHGGHQFIPNSNGRP
eukprot:scaffold8690_cov190-Amphora_coffeaeformis.AAC.12